MKLLENSQLEAISSQISNLEIGDFKVFGSLESYSCKVSDLKLTGKLICQDISQL